MVKPSAITVGHLQDSQVRVRQIQVVDDELHAVRRATLRCILEQTGQRQSFPHCSNLVSQLWLISGTAQQGTCHVLVQYTAVCSDCIQYQDRCVDVKGLLQDRCKRMNHKFTVVLTLRQCPPG